jgi:hypothetical protein
MKIRHDAEVIVGDYPFANQLYDELVPILEKHPDKQNRETNVKAVMTDWYITTPQIERLKKFILNEVSCKFPINIINDKALTPIFKDFWANVYHKGDYADPHLHTPAAYSLVYFLKSKWFYSPLSFTSFRQKIRPRMGRFIIFPSYLRHYVPKHRYNESRMTISGNFYYKEMVNDDWLQNTVIEKVSLI